MADVKLDRDLEEKLTLGEGERGREIFVPFLVSISILLLLYI